ncbi:MAG: LPXTG cell wall anchor domain-containing protein [Candidatus Sulfotelmatobacter sp.]|jgi:LPXTG-motif cell wall-anchored protein
MKNVGLLIVIPVLLVTLGFGQTPAQNSNTEQTSIKGCLGGSVDNYTVAEDGTTQTFRITSSTVDLKPHLGHDVEITTQKANVSAGSDPADNSVIVTAVNMISDHCATVAASTPAVADPTPTAAASTPAAADPTPTAAATTPAAADSTPAAAASAPAVADPTPPATDSNPAPADQTPVATATTPSQTTEAPMAANTTAPNSTENLPQTASSLPLLGLAGLGLLAMGLLIRRFRTN